MPQKSRLPRSALSSGHPCEPRGARRRDCTHRHLARNSSLKHRRKLENRVLLARVSSGLPCHQLLCPGASRGVTTNRTRPAAHNCRSRRCRRRGRRPRRGAGSLARRRSAATAHRARAALLGGAAPNDALQARIVRHSAGSAGFGPLSRVPGAARPRHHANPPEGRRALGGALFATSASSSVERSPLLRLSWRLRCALSWPSSRRRGRRWRRGCGRRSLTLLRLAVAAAWSGVPHQHRLGSAQAFT